MAKGKKLSFMIDIKDNQNETWQGSLLWIQESKQENFRSALELIKLIDSAVEKESNENKEG